MIFRIRQDKEDFKPIHIEIVLNSESSANEFYNNLNDGIMKNKDCSTDLLNFIVKLRDLLRR
jgi:hypothetical protein